MHRYVELRKKLLGVDKLYMYDMYVPLIKLPETSVSFEEGLDIMRDALQPLGERIPYENEQRDRRRLDRCVRK